MTPAAEAAAGADGDEVADREPPLEDARDALDHIDLVNVVPTSIHADTHENPNACSDVRFDVGAQINVAPGIFSNRFRYQIELLDDDEQPTATLDFELQVEYEVDGDFEPSREVAEFLTRPRGCSLPTRTRGSSPKPSPHDCSRTRWCSD